MVVLAIDAIKSAEVILALLWAIVVVASVYSYRNGPCKSLLGPTKIYTVIVSILWVGVYVVAFTGAFSQYCFGTPEALHAIGNGLLIVTVANFILLIYTIDKVIRKCGVR